MDKKMMRRMLQLLAASYLTVGFGITGWQQPCHCNEVVPAVIEGRIYLLGNEPFTELALETKEGEVFTLRGHAVAELKGLEGQGVKVQGSFIEDEHFLYSSKGFLVEEYRRILPGGGTDE